MCEDFINFAKKRVVEQMNEHFILLSNNERSITLTF